MSSDIIKNFKFSRSVKLPSPYKGDKRDIYHLWVKLEDVPKGIPTEVNPRGVNTKTKVYSRIVEGMESSLNSFFINNRGVLISAKDVKIDNINNLISLNIGKDNDEDKALYGVLDGGHTYHAITNNTKKSDQYVHLEIVTNIQNIDELSSARNTSVQVSDKAIAELASKFEFVKNSISNEPYFDEISYKENDNKRIDAIDLVRLMFMFNIFKFNTGSQQPIAAYSGKAQVLKDYLKKFDSPNNPYIKLAELLPDITKLYDLVEKEMSLGYREYYSNGRFGMVNGIDRKENNKTKYYKDTTEYNISQGFIYPILASFRSLIEEDKVTKKLSWKVDPKLVWNKTRSKLVGNTIEMSRQLGSNPQSAGKSVTLWSQNYDTVNTAKLEIMLEQLTEH